jgi:membrane protein implicated in regulation of membrane protease activity
MEWLYSLYTAASIFGVGITLIDILGLFNHHASTGNSTNDTGTDHGSVTHNGAHDAFHMIGHDAAHDHSAASGHDSAQTHDTAHHDTTHDRGQEQTGKVSVISHDKKALKISPLLRFLTWLRSLVYFAFGFGPTGLVALAGGADLVSSFLFSVPAGILFVAGGFLIRRLQTRELDSQVRDRELVFEEAEVIIPIEAGKIGKVRIELGGSYVERFARAKQPDAAYKMKTRVQIVEVTDEFLIVENQYENNQGGGE